MALKNVVYYREFNNSNCVAKQLRHLDYLINLHNGNFESFINSSYQSHTTRNRASKGVTSTRQERA